MNPCLGRRTFCDFNTHRCDVHDGLTGREGIVPSGGVSFLMGQSDMYGPIVNKLVHVFGTVAGTSNKDQKLVSC